MCNRTGFTVPVKPSTPLAQLPSYTCYSWRQRGQCEGSSTGIPTVAAGKWMLGMFCISISDVYTSTEFFKSYLMMLSLLRYVASVVDGWMNEYGALVEWYWQWKIEVPSRRPFLVSFCLPHIPCGVAWNQTQTSTVRGQSVAAWAISWPNTKLLYLISKTVNFSHTWLSAVLYNILSQFLL